MLSFVDDARLRGCNVFTLDFDRRTNSPSFGTAWLATSDGLREYDGYRWTRHGKSGGGLPSDFIRCVLVTRAGVVWVGSDQGAGVYDGKSYRTFGSETNLAGPGVRRIVEDPDGTVWFCSDPWPNATQSGGIASYRDGQWRAYRTKDGLPSEYVVNYFRDSAGRQWVVTKEGVAELRGERWVASLTPAPNSDGFSSGSLAETAEFGLMFSNGYDVFRYTNGAWEKQPYANHHQFEIGSTHDGKVFACRTFKSGRKTVAQWTARGWQIVSDSFDVPHGYSEDIQEDPAGNIWVVGFETVVSWRRNTQWQEFPGVQKPKFVDASGQAWFARTRLGTIPPMAPVRFAGGTWDKLEVAYEDLWMDSSGTVWGWTTNLLSLWRGKTENRFGEAETGLRSIRSGRPDSEGRFSLLGQNSRGITTLTTFDGSNWTARPMPELDGTLRQTSITEPGEGAWFVLQYSDRTNIFAVHVTGTNTESVEIPRQITSEFRSGLYASTNSSVLWLYGDNGLYRWQRGGNGWEAITNTIGRAVYGVLERGQELWVACSGATGGRNGLARLRDGQWKNFEIETLFNFTIARDGTLLLGAKGRFHYLPDGPDPEPVEVTLPENVPADAVVKDHQGRYWAGNESSVYQFTPDGVAPETRILNESTNILSGETLGIEAEAIERFRPIGHRTDYAFSWRINGGEWSPFVQERVRKLSKDDLPPGIHQIEVRARDAGGDVDATPAVFAVQVRPVPIQDRAWFSWMVLGTVSLLTLLALVAARARAQLAAYAKTLEEKVANRTAALEADLIRRQRVELALRESEERLRVTLDNLLEGCQVVGFDWRYLYVNRVAAQQGRKTSQELLGRTMMESYPGIEQTVLFNAIRSCMNDRVAVKFENQFNYPDGTTAIFDLDIQPVAEGIFIHSIDVTARRQAEEAREKLASLVEHSGDFIATASLDGRLTYLNAAGRRMIGFGQDEDLAKLHFGDYVPEPWRAEFLEKVVPQVRTFGFWEGEMQLHHLVTRERIDISRSMFLIRDPRTAEPLSFATVTRDITARKKTEMALRESEERFRQLAENIREVFWLSNVEKNQMLYISPGYEKIWGRTCESLYQSPATWMEAIHPDDRQRVFESAFQRQAAGEYDIEYRIVRPDGDTRWIHDRAFPVRNAAGEVYRVAGIAEDITERRQLELQFRQAQKMEALGTLSGGIAHDFNNILGAIFGNVYLAKQDLDPTHPTTQSIEEIEKAANRAKNLVRQILAFSRRQPQTRQVISMAPVIGEAASLLRATLPAGVELVKSIDADAPNVFADASQIHQVLLNLCTNAWHALDGRNGRIEIQLRNVEIAREQGTPGDGLHRGRYACLAVLDNGHGMDAATLERIFEPFFTTKDPGRGTGLGLAVVHGIVQSHDGVLRVASQTGHGTTFQLYFPAVDAEVETRTLGPRKLRTGAGQRILYVDDESALVDLAARMLRRLGYAPEGYTDPGAAFDTFRTDPGRYDLIITDLHMPGSSGLEFTERVRQVRPDIHVVLSSGQLTEDIVQKARKLGVTQLLHKPNSLEDLSESIHRLLNSKQA